jgi:hypothetical protein
LLLTETDGVLGELDAPLAMLTRRVLPARDRALLAVAALSFEEELRPFATAKATDGTNVSSHVLSSFL